MQSTSLSTEDKKLAFPLRSNDWLNKKKKQAKRKKLKSINLNRKPYALQSELGIQETSPLTCIINSSY